MLTSTQKKTHLKLNKLNVLHRELGHNICEAATFIKRDMSHDTAPLLLLTDLDVTEP